MPTTAHGHGPSLQAGFLQLSPCQECPAPLQQVVLAWLALALMRWPMATYAIGWPGASLRPEAVSASARVELEWAA